MNIFIRAIRAWCIRYAEWEAIGGASEPCNNKDVVIIPGKFEYTWDIVTIYYELRFRKWVYGAKIERFFHVIPPLENDQNAIIFYPVILESK